MAQPEPIQPQPQEPLPLPKGTKQQVDKPSKPKQEPPKPKDWRKITQQRMMDFIGNRLTYAQGMLNAIDAVLDAPPNEYLYDRDQVISLRKTIENDAYNDAAELVDILFPSMGTGFGKVIMGKLRKGMDKGDWEEFDDALNKGATMFFERYDPNGIPIWNEKFTQFKKDRVRDKQGLASWTFNPSMLVPENQ